MAGLKFILKYVDNLLVITMSTWEDHLQCLKIVFQQLLQAGLKVNAQKSFFGRSKLEKLSYWITRDGIQPVSNKVEAIKNIAPPKTRQKTTPIYWYVQLLLSYMDWQSNVLTLLSSLTLLHDSGQSSKQKAFDTMKHIISREMLLAYPNFNKSFNKHTDNSHKHLSAVISKDKCPIAFYSCKLNPAQTHCTTTEWELLSIIELLMEFWNILLGHHIIMYTDHQNLILSTSTSTSTWNVSWDGD